MEFISLSVLMSLAALFLSLPFMFLLSRSKHQSPVPGLTLPPGTYGWPIIGETLEFLKETFIEDRMRKFSPQIFTTSLLGESVAVFCGPDGNKCLFANDKHLLKRWIPRQIHMIFPFSAHASDEAGIIKTLQIFREFLKAESLESYVGIIDFTAKHQLRNSWENKNVVHVSTLSKTYTFSLGCKLLVGIDDPAELAELHDQFDILLKGYLSLPVDIYETPFNKALKASNYIRKDLVQRIKRRKMELTDGKTMNDVFSQMFCTGEAHGKDTEEAEADSATRILGLLVAGDAASIVITFIVKYLAELPHVYDQVLEEQRQILKDKAPGKLLNWEDIQKMKYSWNVACEAMRLESPTRGTFREALTDFTYAGFYVPEGWKVPYTGAIQHRNANYFPHPEKFDPSRFEGNGPAPYTYVPFGGGRYGCPGNGYARLEILVFMHNLVTKFKWEKIFPDEKVAYTPFPMPEKGLPIHLQPHVSSF